MLAILLILMAWFVPMPLWLSVITTVFSGLTLIAKLIAVVIKCGEN